MSAQCRRRAGGTRTPKRPHRQPPQQRQALGIDDVRAEVLPGDKAPTVEAAGV
ncbi:MAG: hypothetical protein ABI574_06095 [Burkholderiales bacterium]